MCFRKHSYILSIKKKKIYKNVVIMLIKYDTVALKVNCNLHLVFKIIILTNKTL